MCVHIFRVTERIYKMNIVPTNVPYSYSLMRQNLISLISIFPFINIQIVGNSVLGKNIYVIKLGKGKKKVFYSASYHANEWITSILLMKFIEDYCNSYVSDKKLYNYSVRKLFTDVSIYIMPMVNPDGVNLVTGNINSLTILQAENIAKNFPSIPFPSRLESKYKWCGFKFTISCWLGECKRN